MASWGEEIELKSEFNMQEIQGDEEKEVYLLLIVHGIGANLESQKVREAELHAGMKKILEGGYFDCDYKIVTHVVDWKTEVEKSHRFGNRLKRVTIPSQWQSAKEMYDYTVPDNLAYLNPRFRPRILETLTHQMNMIVTKLAIDEPRFKGKVSIVAHSLGSVISYDLLTRQKWENFSSGSSKSHDLYEEFVEKIRNGQGTAYHSAAAAVVLHQDNLAENFARPSMPDVRDQQYSFNTQANEGYCNIDNDYLQLIFPIQNFFLFGSPLGMFAAVYFEESFIRSKLPTVEEFYNVFHPSDLVAARIEPLVKSYEYPDKLPNKRSIFSLERDVSRIEIEQEQDEYQFGEQILGPVLVPWYKNHGLCRSQQLLKFFND